MKTIGLRVIVSFSFSLLVLTGLGQSTKIDSLRALLPTLPESEQATRYNELAREYTFIAPDSVVNNALKSLELAQKYKDKEGIISAHLLLGSGYLYTGNFELSRQFTEKGIEEATQLNNRQLMISGLSNQAAYHMNLGHYPEALDAYKHCLDESVAMGYDDKAATFRLNISAILTATGDRIRGLQYLLDALSYYEQKKNIPVQARILNNIALNYHYWKDYNRALQFYERARMINKKMGDYAGLAGVLNNIGETYKDKGDYKRAISYYQQVVVLADSAHLSDMYKAYGWIGLAETYMNTENYPESTRYMGLALTFFEKAQMQQEIATAFLIQAKISYKLNNNEQALRQINRCLEISVSYNMIELQQQATKTKSEIQESMGNYKAAYDNMKSYSIISDTLYSQERTRNFSEIRTELEITQKQNEIELLQKDNQIKDLHIRKQQSSTFTMALIIIFLFVVSLFLLYYIKARKRVNDMLTEKNHQISEQHKELVEANDTKDKFMSIIGHDLRNPIGAFKDVVGQLADFPDMFTEELRQQIIHELRNEAESTYFLLDNLLSWARNQKNSIVFRPDRLDVSALIQSNLNLNISISERKKISISTEIDGSYEAYADHNMVNLIMRNLLSNAIKFTPTGGSIIIRVREVNHMITIEVEDTGIGIPSSDLPRLFTTTDHVSTYGTNHEKGSGLGLLLCKEFVKINGGDINVDSSPGKGSCFWFTLKKFTSLTVVKGKEEKDTERSV